MLIQQSDPKWYSGLVMDLKNNHTHGSDQYPMTITKASDMLLNYKHVKNQGQFDWQDLGGAFYCKDNGAPNSSGGCGHGGVAEVVANAKDVKLAGVDHTHKSINIQTHWRPT